MVTTSPKLTFRKSSRLVVVAEPLTTLPTSEATPSSRPCRDTTPWTADSTCIWRNVVTSIGKMQWHHVRWLGRSPIRNHLRNSRKPAERVPHGHFEAQHD